MTIESTQKSEEYSSKAAVFKREVCHKHCRICDAKNPDFCIFIFEAIRLKFFSNMLAPIIMAHEKRPRLIEALRSFEGFTALFCNEDVCEFHSTRCNIRQKIDCYQMFLTQSGQVLEEGEADKLVRDWNGKLYMELNNQLDSLMSAIQFLRKKKKKRFFKISKRLGKIFFSFSETSKKHYTKKSNSEPKKKVSTLLFHNADAEWAAKIKSILEGSDP